MGREESKREEGRTKRVCESGEGEVVIRVAQSENKKRYFI